MMRRRLFSIGTLIALFVACAKAEDNGHLAAADLALQKRTATFDPNNVITLETLVDSTVTADLILALMTYRDFDQQHYSPYGHESFLATYYSNGLSAVDALVNASAQYRVNPLVLLARAEMAQGLVNLQYYPVDQPSRVEYVFGCGCSSDGACDQAFAGFDQQVNCLARQYRAIVDEIVASGTAAGWAKGQPGTTVDGKTVTPVEEGTVAAYAFEPVVGTDRSGNQLFWTIMGNYSLAIDYTPSASTSLGTAWIGDACTTNEQCHALGDSAVCVTSYPGGMCTVPCSGTCPVRPGGNNTADSACIDTGGGAYCFARCTHGSTSCRGGSSAWDCCAASIYPPQQGVTQYVCIQSTPGVSCATQ